MLNNQMVCLKAWSWLMIACKILGFVWICYDQNYSLDVLSIKDMGREHTDKSWLVFYCICSYHVIHELRAFMKTNHYFTSDMFRRAVGEHFKRSIGQYPTTMERSMGEARNGWFIHVYPQHIVIPIGPLAPDFGRIPGIPITTTWCSSPGRDDKNIQKCTKTM